MNRPADPSNPNWNSSANETINSDSTKEEPAHSESESESKSNDAPTTAWPFGIDQVSNYLLFGLSLPERAVRSTSAAVSGAVKESAALLVPQAFRNSKTYSMLVEQMLDFMAHDVGGVERASDSESNDVENYVARKTVGGFIELAALPLLHVSPMTVLAVVSDIAYGSQSYLSELSSELKKQGVIDEDTAIDHAADLLEAIKKTTASASDALDQPPISIEGLTQTIQQVTESTQSADLNQVLPKGEVERLWKEMHDIAAEQNQSVLEISSAMSMFAMNRIGQLGQGALSTISVAGNMFDRHIIDHYREGLTEIHQQGYYRFLASTSKPYISAMWNNFSTEKETITEDVLSGRLIGRTWRTIHQWFQSPEDDKSK